MWTTIYMANGKEESEEIIAILKSEGFIVKSKMAFHEDEDEIYEILAPEYEAEEIYEFMNEKNIY